MTKSMLYDHNKIMAKSNRSLVVSRQVIFFLLLGVVFLSGVLTGKQLGFGKFIEGGLGELYQEAGGSGLPAKEHKDVITHGPRDKKRIALTFDAEMTDQMKRNLLSGRTKSSFDENIIKTLDATSTKATFFLTGLWVELFPAETYLLSHNDLFELGSHSYTDSSFYGYCYGLDKVTDELVIEEIGATEKILRKYAGIDNTLFRFPGGCFSPRAIELVREAGDVVVHWDVNGGDGFNKNTESIVHNVVDKVDNGSIILLHLNGPPTAPQTADALPKIIQILKSRGYEFVTVTELLGFPRNRKILP